MAIIKILDFTFDVDFTHNESSITKFEGKDSVLYLPNTLTLKNPQGNVVEVKVTSISEKAFTSCSDTLEKLIIRKNNYYRTINNYSFHECHSLKTFIHNDGADGVGCEYKFRVFEYCTSLSKVSLPRNLKSIGGDCFSWCTSLKDIVLPGGITNIRLGAFSECLNLTSVKFEENDTVALEFGERVFYRCEKLESFSMPKQLKTLGEAVFEYCYNLTTINFNSSISILPDKTFNGCTSLNNVIIPKDITEIHDYAFGDCTSMNTLEFESNRDSKLKLGTGVFNNCNFELLIIPEKVFIECNIFNGCHINKLILKQKPNYNNTPFVNCHILDIDLQFALETYKGGFYSYTDSDGCTTETMRFPKEIRYISRLPNIYNLYIDTTELGYDTKLKRYNILEFVKDGMQYSSSNNKQIDIYITSLDGWNYVNSHFSGDDALTNPLAAGGKLYYLKNKKYELFQDLNLEFIATDTFPYCRYKHLRTVRLSGDIFLPENYFDGCSNLETVAIKKLGADNVRLSQFVFNDTNIKTVFYGDSGDDWIDYFYQSSGEYNTNRNNGNLPFGEEVNGKIDLTDLSELGVVFTTYCFPQLSTLFSQPINDLTPYTDYQIVLENNQGILSFHKFKTQLVPMYANDKGNYKKGLVWVRTSYTDDKDGQIKYKYVQGIPWDRKDGGNYEIIESAE